MISDAPRLLTAQWIGPALRLAPHRAAPLVGVYPRGATVVWSACSALYLTSKPNSGPFNVYIPDLQSVLGRMRAGQEVCVCSEHIEIPAAGVSIDLSGASRWPRQAPPFAAPLPAITSAADETLRTASTLYGQRSLSLTALGIFLEWVPAPTAPHPLQSRLQQGLAQLHAGTAAWDVGAIRRGAHLLLGLGDGLTPAGDDVLSGYLAALRFASMAGLAAGADARAARRAILIGRESRTHLLSSSLLWAAAWGAVDASLAHILQRLFSGRPAARDCLAPLLGVGHSSGLDGLAGALLLLNGLANPQSITSEVLACS